MTIEQLKRQAEAAKTSFEEAQARLFRPDGSRLFSDEAHQEQLAVLRSERNTALQEIEQQLAAETSTAQKDLAALENGGPTTLLSTEELERASAARALVADDVASLAPDELITRLRAVLHGGDRGSMLTYMQAGRRRAREMGDSPAKFELTALLEELGNGLVSDERRAELEAARSRIREAGEVREMAYLARREQRSLYEPTLAVPGPGR